MANYLFVSGTQVLDQLDKYATFMGLVFKDAPWNFNWHTLPPEDPGSGHTFLRMLIGYGAEFLVCLDNSNELLGYSMTIEGLSSDALSGGLSDLVKYGEAKPGDHYFAGTMVAAHARKRGIGHHFFHTWVARGQHQRFLTRTQKAAVGVMRSGERLGFRVYREYEFTQAGASLQRVLLERSPGPLRS